MTEESSRISRFYAELSRRRVLKAAVAYIVTSWILIEGSALIFPALLLPDWTHRLVVILAIIGFPVVIVIAWVFDITPAGLERTNSTDSDNSTSAPQAPPAIDSALASIAVLPFEALSTNADDAYLARGVSAEIASALTHLPEVRVVPSRSTSALEDTAELRNIGALLNVQYVLTGNVRRQGNTLRVLAELSDVHKGSVLWSESYDREDDELITVEEEIAAAIVGSFGGEHLRVQIESALDHATDNAPARNLVHRARAYILDYSKDSLDAAEGFARAAIKLDPKYASAHAALASVLSEKVSSGLAESVKSDIAEAQSAINVATKLRPQDSFVLKLAGNVWSLAGEHDKAVATLRRAIEITPFDFGAWGYLAAILAVSGDPDSTHEAHAILDRILDLAPQHPGQAYWMHHKAVAFTVEQNYASASTFARQSVDRQPGLAWAWYLLANAQAMNGNEDVARAAAENAAEANPELSVGEYAEIVERTSANATVSDRRLAGLKALGLL
jgi:adenylate cyclase